MRLSGRIALVTGASRGIGAAIAKALAGEGAKVALNYRSGAKEAEELARSLPDAIAVAGDVGSSSEVEALVEKVLEKWGGIDILVNNAGLTRDNLLPAMADEEWEEVLKVNAGGTFRLCRAVARPMMSKKRGRIVNLSSVAAAKGGRGQTNYSASKGAIEAFTRALAMELAPKGITVNAVAPGVIATGMSAFVRDAAPEEVLAHIPLKRIGTPEDVAKAVVFLASDDAAYITGAVLPVDGGFR